MTRASGTIREARAVVDGTKKAKMKFTSTRTSNVLAGVFPNRVTKTRAIRLPRLEWRMAEVRTKAATISQMMSNPRVPKATDCFFTAPNSGRSKIEMMDV